MSLLASAAIIALVSSASAADLPARPYTKAPAPVPAQIYNWNGFYLGGHVGGAFRGDSNNVLAGSSDGTFMGGVQVGYDYQFAPNRVMGLEANYSFKDTNGVFANRNLGSVTGRLGYTWGPTLLYAKGGYAWADTRFTNGFGGEAAVTVTPSVAVLSTCSPRTGRARSNISITTSATSTCSARLVLHSAASATTSTPSRSG